MTFNKRYHRVIHKGLDVRTKTACNLKDKGFILSVADLERVTCKKCLRRKP